MMCAGWSDSYSQPIRLSNERFSSIRNTKCSMSGKKSLMGPPFVGDQVAHSR